MNARTTLRIKLENLVCRTNRGYRTYLQLRYGVGLPKGRPPRQPQNTTLKSRTCWERSLTQTRQIGLVEHSHGPKNWDALVAVASILERTNPSSAILDAGAELYSSVLPSLFQYGYTNLTGINLVFEKVVRRGPIRYEPGDLTKTRFADASFDAISCLSVIEHGVDPEAYFKEAYRILKPDGILVTSTDYWPQGINVGSAAAYGSPVKIFTEREIQSMLDIAQSCGFALTAPVDLVANDKAVCWERMGLEFTFVTFSLLKAR